MSLPIDEMLTELRAVLEKFDSEPTIDNYDNVHAELMRIDMHCEMMFDDED
jgi:hypothetical protein